MEITVWQILIVICYFAAIVCILFACYKKGKIDGYLEGADDGINAGKETILNGLIQLYNGECEKLIKKRIPQSDFGKQIQIFIESYSRELYGPDSTTFITNPDDAVVTKRDLADCWIHFDDEGEGE